ncbi:MAG: glycoside hydrolase family 97 N-terminal domain-containing protein, partial [Bacteroidota bacterium]|nr:glycoside hydrolase family 97 N-terminal domain-containing protein [Bacteroidota bacterium]
MTRKCVLMFVLITSYIVNAQQMTLSSPDNKIKLAVSVSASGELKYAINYKNKPVLLPSSLGITFKDPAVDLKTFSIVKTDSSEYD